MSFNVRWRIPLGRRLWANLSPSGLSLSARAGRLTANSRGWLSVRLGRGLTWRGRIR
jgi:hypothetical protein